MAEPRTSISSLRRNILKRKGLSPEPKTKRMRTEDELPDLYPKSPLMRYLEAKYKVKLEEVIFKGSLLDVRKYFNWEVDRSTISRWRKLIQKYIGRVYYEEFRAK